MESGLKIIDSPNYILYNDPKRYLERHILPRALECSRCMTKLVVDFVQDVHWGMTVTDTAAYKKAQELHSEAFKSAMKSGLPPILSRPRIELYDVQSFYSVCPVCHEKIPFDVVVRDEKTGKLLDREPLIAYVKERDKTGEKPVVDKQTLSKNIFNISNDDLMFGLFVLFLVMVVVLGTIL